MLGVDAKTKLLMILEPTGGRVGVSWGGPWGEGGDMESSTPAASAQCCGDWGNQNRQLQLLLLLDVETGKNVV